MRSLIPTIALACVGLTTSLAAQYPPPLTDPDYLDSQQNIFLRDEVTYVTVTMDPADLQWLLTNRQTDTYKSCTVNVTNSQINETILNVGIRPRGNSGRNAKKNPWKLSFTAFSPGRRFHGLKKMNVNGDAPDPSLSRSSTLFDGFRSIGVPASRTHHVWMEINDGSDVSGLYIHHEQVDEVFLKAWFGNNDGRLYKCRNKGEPANLSFQAPGLPATYAAMEAYEEENDDFVLLAQFIDFINNTTDQVFKDDIGKWMNVDGFMRAQAADVFAGQWDGLWIGGNNYYLYENTDTGLLEYIPWDLDHSFGMDYLFFPIVGNFGTNFATKPYQGWGNNGFATNNSNPPKLIKRLLDIPNYDEVLKTYCREHAAGPFHPNLLTPRIDQLKAMLAPFAFTGSFHNSSMDNGYDNGDFMASFTNPGSYSLFSTPATWGLKPFISTRRGYIANHYPVAQALPRVFINEVVSDNETTLADEAGDFDDWVELYNDENSVVDLSGWYMSDRPGEARAWQIPAGTTIPAKGYLLVWCDNEPLEGPLHASFKLSDTGESVHLWMPESFLHVQADSMVIPPLGNDQA